MSRQRLVRAALAGGLAAALILSLPTAASALTGWYTTQVTSDLHDKSSPETSGDRVVWTASDDAGFRQVYTWRLGDSVARQLSSGAVEHSRPQVSGDRVVWTQAATETVDLYTIKVGTDAKPRKLGAGTGDISGASVSGDRVVWLELDGAHRQVCTWKSNETTVTRVTSDASDHREPQVSGDRIVWRGQDSTIYQVFTWKAGAGTTRLTDDAAEHHLPEVSGDRIAWIGRVGGITQIFTQRIGTDASPSQLTTDSASKDDVAVSGDVLTWSQSAGGPWGVFTCGAVVGATASPISPPVPNLSIPALSGKRAVWGYYDSGSGTYHVNTFKIGFDTTAAVLASTTTLASQEARVSGDRVVWLQYGATSGFHQILFAKPITKPTLSRSPGSSTITVKRNRGVAKYTLSATVKDADGALAAGKTVYLQTSSNGRTHWKNSYKLKTSLSGRVSKSLSWRSRGTRYYRWYAPSSAGYTSAYATKQTVKVR
jgi:hypothetical protein